MFKVEWIIGSGIIISTAAFVEIVVPVSRANLAGVPKPDKHRPNKHRDLGQENQAPN